MTPVQPDVERGQPLLPIKDRHHSLACGDLSFRRIRVVAFMIVGEEIIERELAGLLWLNLPEQKGSGADCQTKPGSARAPRQTPAEWPVGRRSGHGPSPEPC